VNLICCVCPEQHSIPMVMQVCIIRGKEEGVIDNVAHWVAMSSDCETKVCSRLWYSSMTCLLCGHWYLKNYKQCCCLRLVPTAADCTI
jgi:hypothetical protein